MSVDFMLLNEKIILFLILSLPASAITWLRHGYFASLLFKRHWSLTEVEEKCGGNSSAASSTAVGFEEIMLLHSEV
uniref:Uncharacterized protein n=1 Tax=Brassica campestris TaxID=3711 RepID=M4D7I8_BRACM